MLTTFSVIVNKEFDSNFCKFVNKELTFSDVETVEVVPSEEGDLYDTDDNWVDADDEKDEDYIPPDNVSEASAVESDNVSVSFKELLRNDKLFLVYESKLYESLKFCSRCGNYLDKRLIEDVKNSGSQLHLKLNCLNGCNVQWK